MTRIAVLGASGFVGSAVVDAARAAGHDVLTLRAPRLMDGEHVRETTEGLAHSLRDVDAVVNCAGNPDASAGDLEALRWANSQLPGVIGRAVRSAGVRRYVHVSSAVVQGRRPSLDSSDDVDAFSPYARSKVDGERAALAEGPPGTIVYRPPSVHAPSRRVTRQLTTIARSPLSTVAAPGDRPTPQTHIRDVADAIVFLCTTTAAAPPVVHHPWQGHTTSGLLRMLGGGRVPREVPAPVARLLLRVARSAGRLVTRLSPYARRVELIWLGQTQEASWLTQQGWRPVTTDEDWVLLGHLARGRDLNTTEKDER